MKGKANDDPTFLAGKSETAVKEDLQVARDRSDGADHSA
jgi:hypothetical protein